MRLKKTVKETLDLRLKRHRTKQRWTLLFWRVQFLRSLRNRRSPLPLIKQTHFEAVLVTVKIRNLPQLQIGAVPISRRHL